MQEVTVSPKFQVVIPKAVRERLSLHPGEKLLVFLEEGRIVMRPRPARMAVYLRGLHKDVWDGVDGTSYVREEREGWGS